MPEPEHNTDIRYVVEYRSAEYVGTDNEKTWFVGEVLDHDVHDLAAAMQLAADFKSGTRHPRGAGKSIITQTQIVQQVWVGTVILSDDPDDTTEEF